MTSAQDPSSVFANALSKMEGAKRAVGKVSAVGQNDDVYFEIDGQYDAVQMLLNNGLLRGLSLTHSDKGGRKVPLELTLTNVSILLGDDLCVANGVQDPVRSAALVTQQYLPHTLCPPKRMATPMDTATPELSPLEKSLAGMDEETRKLFETRFGELMGKISELETNGASQQAELSRELESAKAQVLAAKEAQGAAKTNNEILAMQVSKIEVINPLCFFVSSRFKLLNAF